MTLYNQNEESLNALLKNLCSQPKETEWIEFKRNNADVPMIGEYISALSNSASLLGKSHAYVVWGVEDKDHKVVGTTFKPSTTRYKNQELEGWLNQKINPKVNFYFYEFLTVNNIAVVILEITAANYRPISFDRISYIRIGSYKKPLSDFPEKERVLWKSFEKKPFEKQVALSSSEQDVLTLLDYSAYFDLIEQPLPHNRKKIMDALIADDIVKKENNGKWSITNLGAILFAKDLSSFQGLKRKAVRLIQYKNNNKLETIREIVGNKGYAVGFAGLIDYLINLLPSNEQVGRAIRKDVPMYPELALRELVANAVIHQDFNLSGTGPVIELFEDRLEIVNPGIPLVDTQRFLDSPPRSRNEDLASFMRRIGICEERGSGIDKVIAQIEAYQLPAPIFEQTAEHTRVILFSHKELKDMETEDRVRACYQHCCLKYVMREPMNNTSLRERFQIESKNSATASRIISQSIDSGLIRLYDEKANRRSYRYVPFWA